MTHPSIPADRRAALGLSDQLIRLSPGCEDGEDLVEDLLQGLDSFQRSAFSDQAAGALHGVRAARADS